MAGLFCVPLSPTSAAHSTGYSRQRVFSLKQRLRPIANAQATSDETAKYAGSQPIASAPAVTKRRICFGSASGGKACQAGAARSALGS